MTNEGLTVEELDILAKSIDVWKTAPMQDEFMRDIFHLALAGKGDEPIESITQRYKEKAAEREEVGVLLKAKLITMRNQIVNKAVDSILKEKN